MKPSRSIIPAAARWLLAALTALSLVARAPAQPAPEERWLLIFDTSSAMKKRLPAVEAAVKNFLATDGGNQLHPNDTVGVWTFDQQLRTGQFPLTLWSPERATVTYSNLVAFLRAQHYTDTTALAALQPMLSRVMENSERLTVVIFCDGQSDITWTPYNDGINQTFRQSFEERKKTRQPFVLLLRSQRGRITGSTVNFPPGKLDIPPFPPLPPDPKTLLTNGPATASAHAAPKPPAVVPSLVIIGTNVSTNIDDIPKPAPAAPPKAAVAPTETNRPATNGAVTARAGSSGPTASPNPPATNRLEPEAKDTNHASPAAPTNATGPAEPAGDTGMRGWLMLGGGLLVIALALVIYFVVRVRTRGQSSLITSSMNQDRRPPGRD